MDRLTVLLSIAVGFLLLSKNAKANLRTADSVGKVDLTDQIADWVTDMTTNSTRGERNNNPGNLRLGINWAGLSLTQTDKEFAQFNNSYYGIRALAKNLFNYYALHGINTIRGIVERWAPPSENDTVAYVNSVAHSTGFVPDEILNMKDKGTLQKIVFAIIRHENGRVIYTAQEISSAVDAAFS